MAFLIRWCLIKDQRKARSLPGVYVLEESIPVTEVSESEGPEQGCTFVQQQDGQ